MAHCSASTVSLSRIGFFYTQSHHAKILLRLLLGLLLLIAFGKAGWTQQTSKYNLKFNQAHLVAGTCTTSIDHQMINTLTHKSVHQSIYVAQVKE